uniref:Uncharacterized protein n=1 Tax=Triticum urartu TaxID=4572 RepID=A0A8R7URF0_TRIUA
MLDAELSFSSPSPRLRASIEHGQLIILRAGDSLLHDDPRGERAAAIEEQLEQILGEPADERHPLLSGHHRHGLGVPQVPEHYLRHGGAVASFRELPHDRLVVCLPRVRRRLVELHVAEHEHSLHHLLRRQAGAHSHLQDLVEHCLEVGVHTPIHVPDEFSLFGEGVALDHVDVRLLAEGDHAAAPRVVGELGHEEAKRDADVHGQAGHASGHVAHGHAAVELAEGAHVVDHALPLQVGQSAVVPILAEGLDDLVREQRARGDPLLAGLDIGEVCVEALGVVLEEEVLVVLHGHGGHARVHHGLPGARRDEHLGELKRGAERHDGRSAEVLARAVRVVRVREVVAELRRRAPGEEPPRDGLAEEGGAVVGRVQRRAPLGREREILDIADRQLAHVLRKELGEQVGRAIVQEPVRGVAAVHLQRPRRGLCPLGPAGHRGRGRQLPVTLQAGRGALLRRSDGRGAVLATRLAAARAAAPAASAPPAANEAAALGLEAGLLAGGPGGLAAVHDAVEQLGQVLEVAEGGDGGGVARERGRVAGVEPERGGVEALAVGLAGPPHAAEVGDEAERGDRVGGPGGGEQRGDGGGRRAGHHVEEEVEAGVPRGHERRRGVLRQRLPRPARLRRLVEAGVQQVHERVARWYRRARCGGSLRRADQGKAGHGNRRSF